MPTNQRKNARKERSRKNEAKTRKIIWAVLIFVIIVLIIMRVCEIDFASLKNRFTDANGNFTLSLVTDENEYPLMFPIQSTIRQRRKNCIRLITATQIRF